MLTTKASAFQVLVAFSGLLPFPSNFQSEIILKDDIDEFNEESAKIITFLEDYLRDVRKLYWAKEYRRVFFSLISFYFH